MSIINLKESLKNIDIKTDMQYNLTALYESCNLSEEDKNDLVKYIATKEPPFMIGQFLESKAEVPAKVVGDDEIDIKDFEKVVDINDGEDHAMWKQFRKVADIEEDYQPKTLDRLVDEFSWDYASGRSLHSIYLEIARLYDDRELARDVVRELHRSTNSFDGDRLVFTEGLESPVYCVEYAFDYRKDGNLKTKRKWFESEKQAREFANTLKSGYTKKLRLFKKDPLGDHIEELDEAGLLGNYVNDLVSDNIELGSKVVGALGGALGIHEDWDDDDDESNKYELVAHKSVSDSDGFSTDYCMYYDPETEKYFFMFGDTELYTPDPEYADWEEENEEAAWEWFNSYNGFDEEEDLELDEE